MSFEQTCDFAVETAPRTVDTALIAVDMVPQVSACQTDNPFLLMSNHVVDGRGPTMGLYEVVSEGECPKELKVVDVSVEVTGNDGDDGEEIIEVRVEENYGEDEVIVGEKKVSVGEKKVNGVTELDDGNFRRLAVRLAEGRIDDRTYEEACNVLDDYRINSFLAIKKDLSTKVNRFAKAKKDAVKASVTAEQDVVCIERYFDVFLRNGTLDRRIKMMIQSHLDAYKTQEAVDARIVQIFKKHGIEQIQANYSDDDSEDSGDESGLNSESMYVAPKEDKRKDRDDIHAARKAKKASKAMTKDIAKQNRKKREAHQAEISGFVDNSVSIGELVHYSFVNGGKEHRVVVDSEELFKDGFADDDNVGDYEPEFVLEDIDDPVFVAECAKENEEKKEAFAHAKAKQRSAGQLAFRCVIVYRMGDKLYASFYTTNTEVVKAQELSQHDMDALEIRVDTVGPKQYGIVSRKCGRYGEWKYRKVSSEFAKTLNQWHEKNYIAVKPNSWAHGNLDITINCGGSKMSGKIHGTDLVRDFLNKHMAKRAEYDPTVRGFEKNYPPVEIDEDEFDYFRMEQELRDGFDVFSPEERAVRQQELDEYVAKMQLINTRPSNGYLVCEKSVKSVKSVKSDSSVAPAESKNSAKPNRKGWVSLVPTVQGISRKYLKHPSDAPITLSYNIPSAKPKPREDPGLTYCRLDIMSPLGCCRHGKCGLRHDLPAELKAMLRDKRPGAEEMSAVYLRANDARQEAVKVANNEYLKRNNIFCRSLERLHPGITKELETRATAETTMEQQFPRIGEVPVAYDTERGFSRRALDLIAEHRRVCNTAKPVISTFGTKCRFDRRCNDNNCLFLHTGQLCKHNVICPIGQPVCVSCAIDNVAYISSKNSASTGGNGPRGNGGKGGDGSRSGGAGGKGGNGSRSGGAGGKGCYSK